VSAEIEETYGIRPELIAGSGGVFDVSVDGELLFSKFEVNRFPEPGEFDGLIKL